MRLHDKKKFSRIALVMAVSLFLSGCAGNVPFIGKEKEGQEGSAFSMETLGLTPDFSYERKAEKPSIQVDRMGYLPKSTKIAIFQGKELPENFQVIEKDSGEVVYEGEIRIEESTLDGIFTGYGNFSEVEKEGSYYIKCDRIGCSYYFDIGKEVYLEMSREFGRTIEDANNGMVQGNQSDSDKEAAGKASPETMDVCEMVSYLLVASEMYPELLAEIWGSGKQENETQEVVGEAFFRMLRRDTDWLLSMQDEKTGGIYGNAGTLLAAEGNEQENLQEISREATAAFAGTMAKYSYLYQQYDWDYANTCLKAAAKAWRYLDTTPGGNPLGGRFYAASELYRASNEGMYHTYILQNQALLLMQEEDFFLLMGKVTYLSTQRKVDHALCGQIIGGLMKEAERITAEAKEELFLVKEEETDAVLWNMTVMSLANYAIMNHEYVTVIENHVHYLLGRNDESVFRLENPGSSDAAGLLLLFSVVEAERAIIEATENKE